MQVNLQMLYRVEEVFKIESKNICALYVPSGTIMAEQADDKKSTWSSRGYRFYFPSNSIESISK